MRAGVTSLGPREAGLAQSLQLCCQEGSGVSDGGVGHKEGP